MRSLELVGTNGALIDLDSATYRVAPDVRLDAPNIGITTQRTVNGRHITSAVHERIIAQFDVIVLADSPDEADQARAVLLDALVKEPHNDVLLVITRDGGDRRVLRGRCVTSDFGTVDRSHSEEMVVPVDIEATTHPYYQALDANETETSIGVADSTPWTGEMPMDQPVTLAWPWSLAGYRILDADSQTVEVVNSGTLVTWPEWVIEGPASSLSLVSERTGKIFEWTGTLGTGEELVLISEPRIRSVSRDLVLAWDEVSARSQLSEALPGVNPFEVNLAGGTEGVTTLTVRTFGRFTSP